MSVRDHFVQNCRAHFDGFGHAFECTSGRMGESGSA
jgi:hypothetical protein